MKQRVLPKSRETPKDNAAELGQHIGPTDQMSERITHAIRTSYRRQGSSSSSKPHQCWTAVGV
jgi:hypothetical protein